MVQSALKTIEAFKAISLGQRVIFHHVPKCAGTSVSRALRIRYALSQISLSANATVELITAKDLTGNFDELTRWQEIRRFRREFLHYFVLEDIYFIGGHISFSETVYHAAKNRYKFITVLRDPVERFISEYFFNLNREHHAKITLSLSDYLETTQAKINANKFCDYFCGSEEFFPNNAQNNLSHAKENILKFDIVGFTEKMEEFEKEVRSKLKIFVSFGKQRVGKTSRSEISSIVTPELRTRIENLCSADIEFYEYAKEARWPE